MKLLSGRILLWVGNRGRTHHARIRYYKAKTKYLNGLSVMSNSVYPEPQHITNIDAARRQLSTAIELWFSGGDIVSIHTLAHATHEVIDGLSKKTRTRDLLYDSIVVKDEYRKKYNDHIRKPGNFFKHHARDRNKDSKVKFWPALSEQFIIFSILGIELMGETPNATEAAFMFWIYYQKPHLLTEKGRKIFIEDHPPEYVANIQSIPKSEFLNAFLLARLQTTA